MSGKSRNSSTAKGYLALLDAAKLVQQPLSSEAAASKILKVLHHDLAESLPPTSRAGQRPSNKQAAQLSSCGAAALQCAGWLVAARSVNATVAASYTYGVGMCVLFAARALLEASVRPKLLKPLLRPSAGGNVPGKLAVSNGSWPWGAT
jgi:hypothetical protein